MVAVFLILVFSQWHRLGVFRLARWGPSRVRAWSLANHVRHSVATLACQDISLWPTLWPITSWKELGKLSELIPPGVFMYSDYIEIAHGSWFYTKRQYYEISEVARRSKGDLFRTPSYLSYRPALFENEFYYWGLFRRPFADFDPSIRILPAGVLLEKWKEINSDPKLVEDFWAPIQKEPPLHLPARPVQERPAGAGDT